MPFSWACRVPDRVRLLPWLSLCLPVLLGIAGLVGNVIIRHRAIGHPVSNWSSWADPQMLVSGIGTICVAILTFGFKGGARTSYWVHARKGITLSDVHYAWETTTSVAEAAKAIWRGKSLSVAWLSIISVVAIPGNAWLWAHSLYQDDVALTYNGTANIHITPTTMPRFPSMFTYNHPIMTAYRGYITSSSVQFPLDICDQCSVDTLGFGWSELCSISAGRRYDFESVVAGDGPQTVQLFSTDIRNVSGPSGHFLTVNTTYKPGTGCTGNYVTHFCALEPSIVQYRLNITGNSTTATTVIMKTAYVFMDHSMFSSYEEFLGNSFLPRPLKPVQIWYDERLELFAKLGQSLYGTRFSAMHDKFWWHYDDDAFGMGYQSHIAAAYARMPDNTREHPCKLDFLSPMDDILQMYRQLAIRVSVIAAVHSNETQKVAFVGERTERQWLGNKERAQLCFQAALITHIVGVLVVIFMHWGCWNLDRVHSMSPLELINAVAHSSDESTQSLLHILREVEDDASASRLKEFASGWDAEHEQLVVYGKGQGGDDWGFRVEAEEFELAEQL